MEEAGDRFGSLIKQCKPTPSQEEFLRTCPFARQSEVFPPSSNPFGFPVQPTRVVFQTPPEEQQRPPAESAVDAGAGLKSDGGGGDTVPMAMDDVVCTGTERAVDLGKDSDNPLGFSCVNSTQVVDGGAGASGAGSSRGLDRVHDSESESEEFVVIRVRKKRKKKKIGGSGFDPSKVHRAGRDDNAATQVIDLEMDEIVELLGADNMLMDLPQGETEVGAAPSKGDDEVNRNGNGPGASDRNQKEDLAKFKQGNGPGASDRRQKEDLDKFKQGNGPGTSGRRQKEDLDKFKYVGNPSGAVTQKVAAPSEGDGVNRNGNGPGASGRKQREGHDKFKHVSNPSRVVNRKVAGGRRELPPSMTQHAENAGWEAGQGDLDHTLKSLVDALKMVAGELDSSVEEDVDFLEVAESRGMTFPRPRWWPPEGFDD